MLYLTKQWSDLNEECYHISNMKYWFIASGAFNEYSKYTGDYEYKDCVTLDFSEDISNITYSH
jgi:hypothetical protein